MNYTRRTLLIDRMNDLTLETADRHAAFFRVWGIEPEQAQIGVSGEQSVRGAIETNVSVWSRQLPLKDCRTASGQVPLSETSDMRPWHGRTT